MLEIRRREFVALLGGAAAWPLAARAQQGGPMRRIGMLLAGDENDPEQKRRLSAFIQVLAGLGWTDGRNVRMVLRWYGDDINPARALPQELVGLQPAKSAARRRRALALDDTRIAGANGCPERQRSR
jgi:putative ABC transport system substrate-binding protein